MGCHNKTIEEISTDTKAEFETPAVKEFESDGIKYIEESGPLVTFTYPEIDKTFTGEELIATHMMVVGGCSGVQNDGDSSYKLYREIEWPDLYDDPNIKGIKYTVYNGKGCIVNQNTKSYDYRQLSSIDMESINVNVNQDIKLIIFAEIPTTDHIWNYNMQSRSYENKILQDTLNGILIETDIEYIDGNKKTDYYKCKSAPTQITPMEVYKLIE